MNLYEIFDNDDAAAFKEFLKKNPGCCGRLTEAALKYKAINCAIIASNAEHIEMQAQHPTWGRAYDPKIIASCSRLRIWLFPDIVTHLLSTFNIDYAPWQIGPLIEDVHNIITLLPQNNHVYKPYGFWHEANNNDYYSDSKLHGDRETLIQASKLILTHPYAGVFLEVSPITQRYFPHLRRFLNWRLYRRSGLWHEAGINYHPGTTYVKLRKSKQGLHEDLAFYYNAHIGFM